MLQIGTEPKTKIFRSTSLSGSVRIQNSVITYNLPSTPSFIIREISH